MRGPASNPAGEGPELGAGSLYIQLVKGQIWRLAPTSDFKVEEEAADAIHEGLGFKSSW